MSESAPRPGTVLRPVYIAVLLDMMAFALILPVLPFYAMELGATGLGLGLLLTAYSSAKLIGAAAAGRLSDLFGRKPLLVVCLLGSGVSFLLTGLSGSLLVLVIARAIAGLFGGTVATAQAYVADVTTPGERARYLGLLGAAIGTAFIIGPGLGAWLSSWGFEWATFIAAGLAFANAIVATLTIRQSRPPAVESRTAAWRWRQAVSRPAILAVLAATFLTVFAFVSMETTLAFVARDEYGIGERGFGMILAFVGVIMIIVQGGLVGQLAPRVGERRLATLGALLLAVAMFLLPLAPSLAAAMGLLAVLATGQGFASPSLSALLSRFTSHDTQGGMLGIGQSAASAGRAVAPVIAGWLYDQGAAWPFILGGAAAAVAIVGVVLGRTDRPAEASAS